MIKARKPIAMPIAARTTAPKSGVKASNPATKTGPGDGRSPSAIECRACMQIAVMIGVITRNPTTVGTADSASEGDSSYELVSISSPMPSTATSTGTTTAADRSTNSREWRTKTLSESRNSAPTSRRCWSWS
jgi:hypothetical protein